MSKRSAANLHGFKGPTLFDTVERLLKEHGYNGVMVKNTFNVGQTWFGDVFTRRKHEPSAAKLQEIYEVLTGEPLIK